MVTTIRKYTGGAHPFLEFACLSTDTKPVGLVPDNSICHAIDTGKKYYFANNAWHEAPARGGSSEDSGLPDNFPAEGAGNANKFLGFDANGDYTAKDAPSGGGAEKFVVTLTQDEQTEEWTADKTIAEIVAADAAGKIVVATAMIDKLDFEFEFAKTSVFSLEDDGATISVAMFSAVFCEEQDKAEFYSIVGMNQGEGDEWSFVASNNSAELPSYDSSNNGQVLGVSSGSLAWVASNAPMVVTLTESGGTITGDKTYQEVKEARLAGRPVDLVMTGYACSSVLDVSVGETDGESTISVSFIANGQLTMETGAPTDYVGITS